MEDEEKVKPPGCVRSENIRDALIAGKFPLPPHESFKHD